MRFSPSIAFAAITFLCMAPAATYAQEPPTPHDRLNARRDLELARAELRNYWLIEYPREQRRLNAAIELTHAEIQGYKTRLRIYEPYDRFSYGQPFLVTLQEVQFCLRDAELRLRELWAERNALVRLHSDRWRILEHQAFQARLRLAEIEAEIEATEVSNEEPLAQQ